MIIFLGPLIIYTQKVNQFKSSTVGEFPSIDVYYRNGEIEHLMFYNFVIRDWVLSVLKERIKQEDDLFDMDEFFTEKHLISAYKQNGDKQFEIGLEIKK
jgi:hypothetical protein